jgi:lipopolysaccharide export LptBFGC system permease protein LptF
MALLSSRVQRYLLGPLLVNIGVALALFVLLWMAPEAFFNIVQAVQANIIPLKTGMLLLAYQIPEVLLFALPMACLMGSVFLIRRLNQDGEWLGFLTLGVPRHQLYMPLVMVGMGAMLAMAFIQNYVLPYAASHKLALEHQYELEELQPVSALVPLYFGSPPEGSQPRGLLLLGTVSSQQTARDVLMLRFQPGTKQAQSLAEWIEADYMGMVNHTPVLGNAFRLKLNETGTVVQNAVHIPLLEKPELEGIQRLLPVLAKDVEHASLSWLLKARPTLIQFGQWQLLGTLDNSIWDRLITPLCLPLLVLMGVPIALEGPRQQSTRPFTLAALVLFLYLVARPIASQLASTGAVPGSIAAFIPFLLLLMLWMFFNQRNAMR